MGGSYGNGTVFKLSSAGKETLLHSFGSSPYAALVVDVTGNLYGTTWSGGLNNDGTVFNIDAGGQ